MKIPFSLFTLLLLAAGAVSVVDATAGETPGTGCGSLHIDDPLASDLTYRLYQGMMERWPDQFGFDQERAFLLAHPNCGGISSVCSDFANSAESSALLRRVGPAYFSQGLARAFYYPNAVLLARKIRRNQTAYACYLAVRSYLGIP